MKRIAPSALRTFFAAALLGLAGCDTGGGIEPGMPKDATGGVPASQMQDMANMKKAPGAGGTGMPTETPKGDAKPDAEKK
jgi:hypothetical protein